MINIWFSRHAMTADQAEEIGNIGELVDMSELASRQINTIAEADAIVGAIMDKAEGHNIRLFGVIPAPMRHILHKFTRQTPVSSKLEVFESWNVQRSVEGEKPTFKHLQFIKTGEYFF